MMESRTWADRLFVTANYALLALIMLLTLYPCYYVVMASVSNPVLLYGGSRLLLYPRGFSLSAYQIIMKHAMLWRSYANTLEYTALSAVFGLVLTTLGSYVLSRSFLPGKGAMLTLIMITMFFGGGLIPTYLVVVGLGLENTPWAMVIPGAISTYNLIIMMTYFRDIPSSLEESARIDGANDLTILLRIFVPLSAPVIAVITLYIIVGSWNSYIPAIIYLRDRALFPLQVILREILISGSSNLDSLASGYDDFAAYSYAIKYATIIVAMAPMLAAYPFLQRFFVKGVMLGAIKG